MSERSEPRKLNDVKIIASEVQNYTYPMASVARDKLRSV